MAKDIHPTGNILTATHVKGSDVNIQKLIDVVEDGALFSKKGQSSAELKKLGVSAKAIKKASDVKIGYTNLEEWGGKGKEGIDVQIRKVAMKAGGDAVAIFAKVPKAQTKEDSRHPTHRMTLIDATSGATVMKADVHNDGTISERGSEIDVTKHRPAN